MKTDKTVWPRVINAAIGAWVVVATLIWATSTSTLINGVAIGVLIVAASVLALRAVDVILAAWLFIGTWVLPHSEALLLSDILSALAIIVVGVGFRMAPRRMAVVREWPDIPATGDHEPFVRIPRDLIDDGRSSEHGTMW